MQTLEQADGQDNIWIAMIGVSILCHLMVLAGIVLMPRIQISRPDTPPAMTLDLTNFAVPAPLPRETAVPVIRTKGPAARVKKTDTPIVPAPPAVKQPEIRKSPLSVPTKVRVKRSLKKKTFQAENVKKSKIEQLKKDIEARPDSVAKAIESMKNSVTERPVAAPVLAVSSESGEGSPITNTMEIYFYDLKSHVLGNWAFPDYLAEGQRNLKAIMLITIEKDGTISDIWFDQRSGNSYFDETVERAVRKSSPFRALPDEHKGKIEIVRLGFIQPEYD